MGGTLEVAKCEESTGKPSHGVWNIYLVMDATLLQPLFLPIVFLLLHEVGSSY